MVALGCKYLRICHLNNCATGVATQNQELREKHFHGLPERVMNYFRFLARDVREIMASLGITRFNDLVGRSDLLEQLPGATAKQGALDLSPILASAATRNDETPWCSAERNPPYDPGRLNHAIVDACADALNAGDSWSGHFGIRNNDRSVGAMLAGEVARRHGRDGLPADRLQVRLEGTAGQSFGCWNPPGVTLYLEGDANDYVGKGMSGGRIVLTTGESDRAHARRNVICGNACLYGATGGELFANGQAGERFAVRNSGAQAVIEGAGHHACEYMTGGTVVIMGPFGPNLAAGMTGGELFVLDPNNQTERYLNREFVDATPLEEQQFDAPRRRLKALVSSHVSLTGSEWGRRVLDSWEMMLPNWIYIVPRNLAASNDISQQDVPLRLVKA
jgi:glutamate synthase (NADPH/NADH) large chain